MWGNDAATTTIGHHEAQRVQQQTVREMLEGVLPLRFIVKTRHNKRFHNHGPQTTNMAHKQLATGLDVAGTITSPPFVTSQLVWRRSSICVGLGGYAGVTAQLDLCGFRGLRWRDSAARSAWVTLGLCVMYIQSLQGLWR